MFFCFLFFKQGRIDQMVLFPKIRIAKHLRVNIGELLANGVYNTDEATVPHPLQMQPIIISSSSVYSSFSSFWVTLRVWLLTFQAQARVLPLQTYGQLALEDMARTSTRHWPRVASTFRCVSSRNTTWSSRVMPFREVPWALIQATVSWPVTLKMCSYWAWTKNYMLSTEPTTAITAPTMKLKSKNRKEYILTICCMSCHYSRKHS